MRRTGTAATAQLASGTDAVNHTVLLKPQLHFECVRTFPKWPLMNPWLLLRLTGSAQSSKIGAGRLHVRVARLISGAGRLPAARPGS